MGSNSLQIKPFFQLNTPAKLGEGPIYRFEDNTLHFNDCQNNNVFIVNINPNTGDVDSTKPIRKLDIKDSVSVQYFRKNKPGSYIVLYYQGIAFLDEGTGELEVVKEIVPTNERHVRRFNDGAVDARGRFFAGEIDLNCASHGIGGFNPADAIGRLWRYDPNGSLTQVDSGLVCSNGIGWSPDLKTMYLNDSVGQKTYVYDYDIESGDISNKRVLRDFTDTDQEPDGLVMDVDGNIWSAMWGGNRVIVLNPKGEIIKEVPFAAKRITCPTWGGINNDTIYVTSAYAENDQYSGHVFKFVTGTKGAPKFEFAG